MRKINLYIIVSFLSLSSCDVVTGEDGIVIDNITEERISGVLVKLQVDNGHYEEDTTDEAGYFNVVEVENCGIVPCPDDFTITLEKNGYQTLIINEAYYNSELAEWVNESMKDSLIVRLVRN